VLASRLAPIGGGVAVVAACALVLNGLGGTSPAGSGTPAASAAAGHDFTGTDPLTPGARFGWLPAGLQTVAYFSGEHGDGVSAETNQMYSNTSTAPQVLDVTSSATEPPLQSDVTKKPVTVAGSRQAYLETTPYRGMEVLALDWQTTSGSWLRLSGVLATDLRATLLKVADSVAADGAARPLPIHIEGLPKGVTLETAELDDPTALGIDGYKVMLDYHSGSGASRHSFSITASAGKSVTPTNPNVATAKSNPAGGTCKDSQGLHICVQDDPNQPGPDPLASIGGAQGLLDRITSLGTDRAKWTTGVVN
jgi:hypothetical protein